MISQEVEQPIRALRQTANNTDSDGLFRQAVQTSGDGHIRHPGTRASGKTDAGLQVCLCSTS